MNAIETYANARNNISKQLHSFIANYKGKQIDELNALAEKIQHMCFNIGCPSSVMPMLQSIANGKIKHWVGRGSDAWLHDDRLSHGKKVSQRNVHELWRKVGKTKYCNETNQMVYVERNIDKGHFRWNWTAYILDYETRDYINDFFFNNTIKQPEIKSSLRVDVVNYFPNKTEYDGYTTYWVDVVTSSGNEYRYTFYPDIDRVVSNFDNGQCTAKETAWVISILRNKYKFAY